MVVQVLDTSDLMSNLSAVPLKAWGLGRPGTAKTGSLESLLRLGLTVRLLSADGNYAPLLQQIAHRCPHLVERLDVVRIYQESQLDGFDRRIEDVGGYTMDEIEASIMKWPGKEPQSTKEWTAKNEILVIDDLSTITRAAEKQIRRLNNFTPGQGMEFKHWGAVNARIANFYERLAADTFQCNVLCFSHVDYIDIQGATSEGASITLSRGFPLTMGKSLGQSIAGLFPVAIFYDIRDGKRIICTRPTQAIDVKIPLPSELLESELSVENGLAQIFALWRGENVPALPSKEKPKL